MNLVNSETIRHLTAGQPYRNLIFSQPSDQPFKPAVHPEDIGILWTSPGLILKPCPSRRIHEIACNMVLQFFPGRLSQYEKRMLRIRCVRLRIKCRIGTYGTIRTFCLLRLTKRFQVKYLTAS